MVFAAADEHEWTFDIALGSDFLKPRPIAKRLEATEIILQSSDVAVPPAAVNQIVLTVFVAED